MFESRGTPWPASSESFWTTLFAMFALHIGGGPVPRSRLTIWQCTNGVDGKWYAPRESRSTLDLADVTLDAITVEPRALSKPWPGLGVVPPADAGGFSPDIVIRSARPGGGDHFIVIENKITSAASLMDNQVENYPRLARWLTNHRVSFDMLLLKSVGCCKALYNQARAFQDDTWGSSFGILLWEQVLREMRRTNFTVAGLPLDAWERYTTALETDFVQA
jgi:hypothetical protein